MGKKLKTALKLFLNFKKSPTSVKNKQWEWGSPPLMCQKTKNPRTTQAFHAPQQAQHKLFWQYTLLFSGTGDVGITLKPHEL